MINRILERLEEKRKNFNSHVTNRDDVCMADGIEIAKRIVQEVAKEYGEKKLYSIDLEGCDDETTFEMELTTQEHLLLERVSKLANETSTYGCMPRMYVTEIAPYQKGE